MVQHLVSCSLFQASTPFSNSPKIFKALHPNSAQRKPNIHFRVVYNWSNFRNPFNFMGLLFAVFALVSNTQLNMFGCCERCILTRTEFIFSNIAVNNNNFKLFTSRFFPCFHSYGMHVRSAQWFASDPSRLLSVQNHSWLQGSHKLDNGNKVWKEKIGNRQRQTIEARAARAHTHKIGAKNVLFVL